MDNFGDLQENFPSLADLFLDLPEIDEIFKAAHNLTPAKGNATPYPVKAGSKPKRKKAFLFFTFGSAYKQ